MASTAVHCTSACHGRFTAGPGSWCFDCPARPVFPAGRFLEQPEDMPGAGSRPCWQEADDEFSVADGGYGLDLNELVLVSENRHAQ